MGKEVREISRFFCCAAAPVSPLRLRARPRVNANFYPKIPAAQYVGDVELLTARTETEEAFGFWVARKLATDFLFPNPQ